jgi:hypothetical protein
MWNEIERDHPIPWAQAMAATARAWADHRARHTVDKRKKRRHGGD